MRIPRQLIGRHTESRHDIASNLIIHELKVPIMETFAIEGDPFNRIFLTHPENRCSETVCYVVDRSIELKLDAIHDGLINFVRLDHEHALCGTTVLEVELFIRVDRDMRSHGRYDRINWGYGIAVHLDVGTREEIEDQHFIVRERLA